MVFADIFVTRKRDHPLTVTQTVGKREEGRAMEAGKTKERIISLLGGCAVVAVVWLIMRGF